MRLFLVKPPEMHATNVTPLYTIYFPHAPLTNLVFRLTLFFQNCQKSVTSRTFDDITLHNITPHIKRGFAFRRNRRIE